LLVFNLGNDFYGGRFFRFMVQNQLAQLQYIVRFAHKRERNVVEFAVQAEQDIFTIFLRDGRQIYANSR
jgi:hypothetical protein